ncbi:MFS transporter [Litoreibacter arenae]|uniref:Major facilitator superfamily (MFS) transporter n=1 Tax=Litoreibacter arenae DSM 19593 TaxID=1123360 RepID=S9RGC0_9RHOB|nr:MFS transporter [Litoreibacter arenae]EPX77120.1 Major facilitator superfamily (MFS) transporter [Litoreibacter arenae DSM 19593]
MSVLSALRLSHIPALAFAILGLYWGCFAALVPLLKERVGAGDGLFGLLLLGTACGLATTMWFAPLVDRLLGRWSMGLSAVALSLAFLLPGAVTSPIGFFLAMFACGLASGLTDVIMNARVSDLEARSGRSLMNANHGTFSLAYAVGAFATGLAREAGVSPVALFAVLAVLVLALVHRLRMTPAASEASDAPASLPWGIVLLCGAVVLIAFMSEAAVEAWSALHVERTLGGSAAEGALGPTMLGLTMAVGRYGGQAVSERLSTTRVIIWAAVLAVGGTMLVVVAPVPLVAYLGFGIMGLGISVIGPMGLALVGRLVPPSLRTVAISRTAVLGFLGFFAAPAIMGFVSEGFGLRAAFGAVALLLLLLLPLVFALRKRGA